MRVEAKNVGNQNWPSNPGELIWTGRLGKEGIFGIVFCCPCGCGETGALALDVPGNEGEIERWQWNGDRDKPTLTPSIQKTTGCCWHGYLTDGFFTSS